jgi:hypothetical protein
MSIVQYLCASNNEFGDPCSTTYDNYITNSGDTLRILNSRTHSSSSSTCYQGEICWDSNYLYVAIADNTWTRCALSSF